MKKLLSFLVIIIFSLNALNATIEPAPKTHTTLEKGKFIKAVIAGKVDVNTYKKDYTSKIFSKKWTEINCEYETEGSCQQAKNDRVSYLEQSHLVDSECMYPVMFCESCPPQYCYKIVWYE